MGTDSRSCSLSFSVKMWLPIPLFSVKMLLPLLLFPLILFVDLSDPNRSFTVSNQNQIRPITKEV